MKLNEECIHIELPICSFELAKLAKEKECNIIPYTRNVYLKDGTQFTDTDEDGGWSTNNEDRHLQSYNDYFNTEIHPNLTILENNPAICAAHNLYELAEWLRIVYGIHIYVANNGIWFCYHIRCPNSISYKIENYQNVNAALEKGLLYIFKNVI